MCDFFKLEILIDSYLACAEFIDVKDPGRLALAFRADLLKTVLLSVEVSGAIAFIVGFLFALGIFLQNSQPNHFLFLSCINAMVFLHSTLFD